MMSLCPQAVASGILTSTKFPAADMTLTGRNQLHLITNLELTEIHVADGVAATKGKYVWQLPETAQGCRRITTLYGKRWLFKMRKGKFQIHLATCQSNRYLQQLHAAGRHMARDDMVQALTDINAPPEVITAATPHRCAICVSPTADHTKNLDTDPCKVSKSPRLHQRCQYQACQTRHEDF